MKSAPRSMLDYSSVNEDWRTEAAALKIAPGDVVLAVTGGGRPLDLLGHDPARVLAVDVNPAQTALVELEAAALRRLPFDEYAAFLGLAPARRRWRRATLASLLPHLGPSAGGLWRAGERLVSAGVLYQGRWERFFRRLSRLARLARGRDIRTLFSCGDLDAQRRFVRERWDTPGWRRLHEVLLSRAVLRIAYGDPAFFRHAAVACGPHVYDRMLASLDRVLARENFMVSLVLLGRLTSHDLPPRLTRDGSARIRERLDRLELVTADVVELLAEALPERSISCFSLSDVPSYLDQERFERLVAGIVRCAIPGARVCIRLFLSRQRIPQRLADRLVRDQALEARLASEDHAFAYDFIVGSVRGA